MAVVTAAVVIPITVVTAPGVIPVTVISAVVSPAIIISVISAVIVPISIPTLFSDSPCYPLRSVLSLAVVKHPLILHLGRSTVLKLGHFIRIMLTSWNTAAWYVRQRV